MSASNPVMDVLYLNTYNHVLAIFTRAAEPATLESDASTLVGGGLRIYCDDAGNPGEVVAPSSLVGLLQVPFNGSQLLVPRTLSAAQGNKSTVLTTPSSSANIVAGPAQFTITPLGGFASSTPILVLVNDPSKSAPIQVTAQGSGANAIVAIPQLASGVTYWALVAVAGYPLQLLPVTG